MKRELTLTDIAGYLPYGLKLLDRKRGMTTVWEWQSAACCDWNGEEKVEMISGEKYSEELVMASPILRPMSDLFVKITERGYNDGKPFIPIFMMAKIKYPEFTHFTHCNLDSGTVFMSSPQSPAAWYEYDEEKLSIWEYDLLHRLHLDYRGLILAGLAVSVHDLPTNPYEA